MVWGTGRTREFLTAKSRAVPDGRALTAKQNELAALLGEPLVESSSGSDLDGEEEVVEVSKAAVEQAKQNSRKSKALVELWERTRKEYDAIQSGEELEDPRGSGKLQQTHRT